ncbi:MAG: DUF58 domain-containing protein, partial [Mycobacteriales bacterium]
MTERRTGGDLLRALRGALTPRGSAFFAAALAALLLGEILGERDLVSIAALLAALPVVSVVVVARSRYRIRLRRTLTPRRVEAGHEARVLLRLENAARLPTSTLLMEDTLPYALGGRPRFVLRGLESTGVREVTYGVRTEHRGRFEIGPLTVRVSDPFGCAEITRSFSSVETLTVTPVVWELPSARVGGSWLGGGEGRSTTVAATGEADVSIREYREGDDLRRIHWKATARTGELMVRRDEQPRLSRGSILLDTRAVAHRGDGPSSSFEWAVSAAASIGLWLSGRGYGLRLVTIDGTVAAASSPGAAASQLLDTLAVVTTARSTTLGAALPRMAGPGGAGGLTVAVLGLLDRPEAERIAALGP